MRVHQKYNCFFFLLMAYLIAPAHATPLTPPGEPKENNFYVCFDKRRVNIIQYAPLVQYKKYQYTGCIISRIPCCDYKIETPNCPPRPLNLFAWFNNYPDALNAFYRCAYSS